MRHTEIGDLQSKTPIISDTCCRSIPLPFAQVSTTDILAETHTSTHVLKRRDPVPKGERTGHNRTSSTRGRAGSLHLRAWHLLRSSCEPQGGNAQQGVLASLQTKAGTPPRHQRAALVLPHHVLSSLH